MRRFNDSLRVVFPLCGKSVRRLFFLRLLAVLLVLACKPGEAAAMRLWTAWTGPHLIAEDLVIPAGDTLYLAPGTVLLFEGGANLIVEGSLFAFGTAGRPVRMEPRTDLARWGKLIFRKAGSAGALRHVRMAGIRIQTLDTDLLLQHVDFHRKAKLPQSEATLFFRKGHLWVDQCAIYGNGTGEGLIVIKGDDGVVVQDSYFERVADAVELITVDSGLIRGNVIIGQDNPDDGIDLNNCKGGQVLFNSISGYPDCGIEISSDNFGACRGIEIRGNIIAQCSTGILVKQHSDAQLVSNLFLRNEVAFDDSDTRNGNKETLSSIYNCWFIATQKEVFREIEFPAHKDWIWLIPGT